MKFKRQNIIRIVAGSLVTFSAIMGYFVNQYWLALALFVGLNLFQYGFTNWCLMEEMLKKFGFNE